MQTVPAHTHTEDVPVYAEDTAKGDRFLKDRQHVHLVHDGVQLISAAVEEKKERGKMLR